MIHAEKWPIGLKMKKCGLHCFASRDRICWRNTHHVVHLLCSSSQSLVFRPVLGWMKEKSSGHVRSGTQLARRSDGCCNSFRKLFSLSVRNGPFCVSKSSALRWSLRLEVTHSIFVVLYDHFSFP
jgi:hypothetical protein